MEMIDTKSLGMIVSKAWIQQYDKTAYVYKANLNLTTTCNPHAKEHVGIAPSRHSTAYDQMWTSSRSSSLQTPSLGSEHRRHPKSPCALSLRQSASASPVSRLRTIALEENSGSLGALRMCFKKKKRANVDKNLA